MRTGIFNLLKTGKKARKTIADYQQELLVKQGREQFKRLLEKGINVPVVML
jgi:hypothetical protein